jgi:hypothetical protein
MKRLTMSSLLLAVAVAALVSLSDRAEAQDKVT